MPPRPKTASVKPHDKTIHPQIEKHQYALTKPSAQNRLPRGTSNIPLNAAWFPT